MSEIVMVDNDSVIDIARQLVDDLEEGNDASASQCLDALSSKRDQGLFREIGKITRKLHNSLRELQIDSKLVNQAENTIPEARERLNYVVTLTEQAADKTLTAVETSLPLIDSLNSQAESFSEHTLQFKKDNDSGDITALIADAEILCQKTTEYNSKLREQLSNIMMAQDFQDLTGQIIGQVITIAQDIEGSLVDLVRISGQQLSGESHDSLYTTDNDNIEASGPQIPGLEEGEVASNQDDVDDLLSSLGF